MKFDKFIFLLLIVLALTFFVSAVGYTVVYTDVTNAAFFNQTNLTDSLGISLLKNSSGYNFSSGDFSSFVFMNTTSIFWNLSLGTADTYSARSGVVNNFGINLSEPSLVAYLPLDSTNGTFFADAKGINNGTCSGIICPSNMSGLSSPAKNFDGTNDLINNTDNSYNDILGAQTWSAWIYPTNVTGQHQILAKHTSLNQGSFEFHVYNGQLVIILISSPSGNYMFNVSSPAITINKWYHVATTYNGEITPAMELYINGINNATTGGISGYTGRSDNTADITIGYNPYPGTPSPFNGSIDEVLIYNKSLSTLEINQIYKAGLSQHANTNITLQTRTANSYNISDSGLVALWGLNNATGENATYFKDETGRNNGTCSTCPILTPNGTVGNAMSFDGADDYLKFTNNPSCNLTNIDWSAGAWVYSVGVQNFQAFLASDGLTAGNGSEVLYFEKNGATYRFTGWKNGGTQTAGTSTLVLNKWYYLMAARNSTSLNLYVNGVLDNADTSVTPNFGCLGREGQFMEIGANGGGSENFNGTIDEVRIYNRSLNVTEIQNLYQLGSYHLNWNNNGVYSSATIVQDNVAISESTGGKFMQFRANFRTNNTQSSPYLLNHSVISNGLAQPCDFGDVYTTCVLNHTYKVTNNEVINANNFTIADSGVLLNNSGISFTINLTGNFTMLSGARVDGSGGNATFFPSGGMNLTISVAQIVNLSSGSSIILYGGARLANDYYNASKGGFVNISANKFYSAGSILLTGGSGPTAGHSGNGGDGGSVFVISNITEISGAINTSGGNGLNSVNGCVTNLSGARPDGGDIIINSKNISISGRIDVSRGRVGNCIDGENELFCSIILLILIYCI